MYAGELSFKLTSNCIQKVAKKEHGNVLKTKASSSWRHFANNGLQFWAM